jgi:drug/metabolite transporter (DMT)-like permease
VGLGVRGDPVWAWVLARVPASTAAPSLLLISPAAVVIAWAALGEQPR